MVVWVGAGVGVDELHGAQVALGIAQGVEDGFFGLFGGCVVHVKAAVNVGDFGCVAQYDVDVMAYDNHPKALIKRLQEFKNMLLPLGIYARGGFVQKKQFGFGAQGSGDKNPLALTSGEFSYLGIF